MNRKKFIATLYEELPLLVGEGVISDDNSRKIQEHYGPVSTIDKISAVMGILLILGAFCVGIGVILLFAYNWSNLGRSLKTIISFVPLLISWLLIAKQIDESLDSKRDSVTIFNMLASGACIALISQVYHLPGDITKFLLSWMLISLPVVYILKSSIGALLYLVGITIWAVMSQVSGGHALLFWGLAGLVIPRFADVVIKQGDSLKSSWLSSGVLICFTVALGVVLEKTIPGLWIVAYSSFFAIIFLVPSLIKMDMQLWVSPFSVYANIATAILVYMFSFKWVWNEIGWNYARNAGKYFSSVGNFDIIITFCFFIISLFFFLDQITKRKWYHVVYGSIPLAAALCYSIVSYSSIHVVPVFIFNALFIGLGSVNLFYGISDRNILKINYGAILITIIIFTRFVDFDMPILLRAIVFIVLGSAFIGINKYLAKWVAKVSL